jgi:hypothetical protein
MIGGSRVSYSTGRGYDTGIITDRDKWPSQRRSRLLAGGGRRGQCLDHFVVVLVDCDGGYCG